MISFYDCPTAHMHAHQQPDGSVVFVDSITRRAISMDGYTLLHTPRPEQMIDGMVRQLVSVRRDTIEAFLAIREYRNWHQLLGIHAYPVTRLACELYDATRELCQGEIASNPCAWYDPCSYYRGCGDTDDELYKESSIVLWNDPCMRYSQYKMTAEVKGLSGVYT
jgi:hypothetical protein